MSDLKHVSVQNFPGLSRVLHSQIKKGFIYFRKYDRALNVRLDAIIEGFWTFHNCQHTRLIHMLGLHKVLNIPEYGWITTAHKMKFSIKDFFSKCDQILSKLRIWSHILKKSFMENFIFCAVNAWITYSYNESVPNIPRRSFTRLWMCLRF